MTHQLDRRSFLVAGAATAGLAPLSALPRATAHQQGGPQDGPRGGPVVISSGNGMPAVTKAMEQLNAGVAPVEAAVAGVSLVEDDPNDNSVGLGGLPDESGVVTLDASTMDGPSHKAGAVGGLRNIRNASQVALTVLRRTDHVMLVGEGARRFAVAHGFKEENLLTEASREAWLKWKRNLNPNDDWLDDDQEVPHTTGTIHCSALNAAGELGACTTTSGLSWKIPGRVGDSPIIGAGMFVDNEVGAAGATGRGEACIQSCAAFQVVRNMADGDLPTDACLKVLRWIASHTKRADLLRNGRPRFNVVLYAVRKDGEFGSASIRGKRTFAVHDGTQARTLECASLY